jgi:two-component system, sensor histidine kinase PdtaS
MGRPRNRPFPADARKVKGAGWRSQLAPVLRIVLPYVALGSLWILFSDRLLLILSDDPLKMVEFSTAKGWLFILVTALLLLLLVRGEISRQTTLEAELRERLKEKGALLAELNHRVKNNLQVISSILNLEAQDAEGDEARMLSDRTRARIRSMTLAHERLFESGDFAWIDLGAYLRVLWDALLEVYGADGACATFDVETLMAGSEEAVPFGLLATEAITNALRYGAGAGGARRILISLRGSEAGMHTLSVRDEGSGLPPGSEGLGLQLMDALASQLRGRLELFNEGGAVVRVVFPAPKGKHA